MATQILSPGIWQKLGQLFGGLTAGALHPSRPESSPEERRAEREYLNETIRNNPGAFSGELDVQNMMMMYHGRF